ncbi:MAG: hypothetical protein D6744_16685 [Planctomycetota bacterium]|nr:MAG: hypothetical protein D6744_16685 [Planctomycetota bacterium]
MIRVTENVISGAAPDGDAAFDELKAMGVRTILSVDGAAPDVDAARARGMRYVHLPVGYHGIEPVRRLELARALRDLPGAIYVHCHHGKHRGPAAAAVALVVLGELTPQQGVALMKSAGAAKTYQGLYDCVQNASAAMPAEIDAVACDFPEVATPSDLVQAMAAAQEALDHLYEIREAGWNAPRDHPDLVPLAEAGRLEGLLRGMVNAPADEPRPDEFIELLTVAHRRTQALEAALHSGAPNAQRSARLSAVKSACRQCHMRYRDHR